MKLRELLIAAGMNASNIQDKVVSRMKERFPGRVTICLHEQDKFGAKDIYDWMADLYLTATCIDFSELAIIADCVYDDTESLRLQVCFASGVPSVLKIVTKAEHTRAVALNAAGVHHPHLVQQTPYIIHGKFYVVMPLLRITASRLCGIPSRKAMELWEQIGSALEHLHDRNFAHKDVKSDNIAIDYEGRFILIDLGDTVPIGDATSNSTPNFVPTDLDGVGPATALLDWGMLMMTVFDRMQPAGEGIAFKKQELSTVDLLRWLVDNNHTALAAKMSEKFKVNLLQISCWSSR